MRFYAEGQTELHVGEDLEGPTTCRKDLEGPTTEVHVGPGRTDETCVVPINMCVTKSTWHIIAPIKVLLCRPGAPVLSETRPGAPGRHNTYRGEITSQPAVLEITITTLEITT